MDNSEKDTGKLAILEMTNQKKEDSEKETSGNDNYEKEQSGNCQFGKGKL